MSFELRAALSQAGIQWRDRRSRNRANTGTHHVNICCPFCLEARFHCGVEESRGWFHCFVCSESGSWRTLQRRLLETINHPAIAQLNPGAQFLFLEDVETRTRAKQVSNFGEQKLHIPLTEEDVPIWAWLTTQPSPKLIQHPFRERGLDLERLLEVGVSKGVGNFAGFVTFPQSQQVIGRKFSAAVAGPKWRRDGAGGDLLYGSSWATKASSEIGVVVEGVCDCLRFPVGSAVAMLGLGFGNNLPIQIASSFPSARKIIFAVDRDTNYVGYRRRQNAIKLSLVDLGYEVASFPWKQVDDDRVKDVDEFAVLHGEQALWDLAGLEKSSSEQLLL